MPRSPLIYNLPPGTTPQQPNTVISSEMFNTAMEDIEQTFNTAMPVAFGGTGATSAADAREALGAVQRGGGTNMSPTNTNNIIVGWDGPSSRMRGQVDGVPQGFFAMGDFVSQAGKAASGWTRTEHGVIIQWGRTAGGGDTTIAFPISFPTICASITVSFDQANTSPNEIASVNVSARTNTDFTFRGRFLQSGGPVGLATQPVMWMAIGY